MTALPFIFDVINNQQSPKYPPYNILSFGKDFLIEVATAGFNKEELNVELKNDVLYISGQPQHQIANSSYLHKGISSKPFSHRFGIPVNYEIVDCNYIDGILSVNIKCKDKEAESKKINIQ